ncbi:MAG: hypothetical protein GY844_15330 [Bradyrhizobium sp.]|jgi:uncharacterized protein (UPF0333 family)|uniref:hypothetical protein n=1 Tax=unclassified Sphingomonas TaxID=196159 RepID=UPI000AC211AE|nr:MULTISPECIES: hypothetical protein [unclassified Sphingomonas]MCP4617792.1 hypothetical protein [Bradyrhizobium sp.]
MVEPVTGRSDGVAAKRRGGGAGLLIGLALLVAVVIGAIYLFNQDSREDARTDAVGAAADKVGDTAKDVGGAAKSAANRIR